MEISSATREKLSWLLLESLLIVVSILLAFWIDAWWDDRQEEKRLEGWLATLEPAFAENLQTLEANIDLVARDIDLMNTFVVTSAEEISAISMEERAFLLWSFWRLSTANNRDNEIAALLGSGNIELVRDPLLRKNLGIWQGRQSQFAEVLHLLQGVSDEALPALTAHEKYALELVRTTPGEVVVHDDLLRELRADPEIVSIAARKAAASSVHLRYLQGTQRHTELLLGQIQSMER